MSTEVVDVHHLDAHAEEYFEAERREPLAGWAAQVADTDFRGRPRARLVAALVLADRDPTDRQAEVEARAALRSLQRARTRPGCPSPTPCSDGSPRPGAT